MEERHQWQLHQLRRAESRPPRRVYACIAIAGAVAPVWAWVLATDPWSAPTPVFGHALFWALIVGMPFLTGLFLNRVYAASASPAGLVVGAVAVSLYGNAKYFDGETLPVVLVAAWSGMMFAAWIPGYLLAAVLAMRRRPPREY